MIQILVVNLLLHLADNVQSLYGTKNGRVCSSMVVGFGTLQRRASVLLI